MIDSQHQKEQSGIKEPQKEIKTRRYRLIKKSPYSHFTSRGTLEKKTRSREEVLRSIMSKQPFTLGDILRLLLNRIVYLITADKRVATLYFLCSIPAFYSILCIYIITQDIRVETPGDGLPLESFIQPEDDQPLSENINSLSVTSYRLLDPLDYFSYLSSYWKYRQDVDLFNPDYFTPDIDIESFFKQESSEEVAKIQLGSDILDMQMSVFININRQRGVTVPYSQRVNVISVDYPKNYEGLWNIYPNDTILSINGTKITDPLDVVLAEHFYKDKEVSLELEREGNRITVVTELPNLTTGRIIAFTDPDFYTPFNRFANLYTKNIEGRSAGISTALAYYDTYIEDVSKDRKIALSGILNPDGTVSPIAGVNLKTIQAIEEEIDILFFANDVSYNNGTEGTLNFDNYSEAKRTLERYNSDITLVGVDTFDDIIHYLKATKSN